MHALVLNDKNAPLQYKEVAPPQENGNQVLVHIRAAALNHRDVWIQKGLYAGLRYPIIVGSDGAGIYDGKEVIINPSLEWGDNPAVQSKNFRILGLPDNGTFADFVLIDRNQLFDKPKHLTFEQAAALPLAGLTAFRALFTKCNVKKGEKVLITGIGGGVALFACQFAVAAGAAVYVTSSSEDKIERAIALGAKGGGNYTDKDWADGMARELGGFDVIIDGAGGAGFMDLVKVCKPAGRICFYGGTKGDIPNVNPRQIFWKQLSIYGSTMGTSEEFAKMLRFVKKHTIVPIIDQEFDLKEGQTAFDRMDKGEQFGKIILVP
jgi:NADPH:quinone reductase-like Zn-dependent oxidoreductase